MTPASQLGYNTRRHIHYEAVLPIQQIEEWPPDRFSFPRGVFAEDFHATAVLL